MLYLRDKFPSPEKRRGFRLGRPSETVPTHNCLAATRTCCIMYRRLLKLLRRIQFIFIAPNSHFQGVVLILPVPDRWRERNLHTAIGLHTYMENTCWVHGTHTSYALELGQKRRLSVACRFSRGPQRQQHRPPRRRRLQRRRRGGA
jgi:hypothetical protein